MSESLLSRKWLDAEMERIWLTTEGELRRLQQLQLRPPPTSPAISEVEGVLAERRAARNGEVVPYSFAELARALSAVMHKLGPLRGQATARLTERLGVSLSNIDGLLLVAGPSIDPPLADLFAAVRGTTMARRGVDVALIG